MLSVTQTREFSFQRVDRFELRTQVRNAAAASQLDFRLLAKKKNRYDGAVAENNGKVNLKHAAWLLGY